MQVHAMRGVRPSLVCGSCPIGLAKLSISRHDVVEMFSLEDHSGEHELSVCFLISFPCLYFCCSLSLVALISARHSAESLFGLEWKIFYERRRLHSYACLSILHPSAATAFPSHHLHGSRNLKRQVFSLCWTSPAYTASSSDAHSMQECGTHLFIPSTQR